MAEPPLAVLTRGAVEDMMANYSVNPVNISKAFTVLGLGGIIGQGKGRCMISVSDLISRKHTCQQSSKRKTIKGNKKVLLGGYAGELNDIEE